MTNPTMTIDGEAVTTDRTLEVMDPARGEPFARVPDCSREDLERAVDAACRAFETWKDAGGDTHRAAGATLADVLETHSDELAELLVREQGKPLAKAKGEIGSCLRWARAFSEMEIPVEVIRDTPEQRVELRRRPVGPVAAITAWNYPLLLATFKIAPALVTGNTVVAKPSPFAPVATLRLGELLRERLPAGVVNVVSGGDELGRWLTEHPGIRKVTFTGSVATGKKIMAAAAGTLKRVTLELGGNDAAIVLPDVDLERQIADIFWGGFANCGQVCAAIKRLYVPDAIYDRFVDALVAYARTVKVGEAHEDGVQMGPIQNAPQLARVRELVEDAEKRGATVAFRGDVPDSSGFFYPITILRDVAEGLRVVDEEPFGPVLPVLRYTDLDEAVRRANASEYGLGASVWSADPARAGEVAARLESGSAWVNAHPAMGPDVPFGGVKSSGVGVEGSLHGLEEYTVPHVVWVNRKSP